MDSCFRRNDGMCFPQIGQKFWQLLKKSILRCFRESLSNFASSANYLNDIHPRSKLRLDTVWQRDERG
jgi:hypothetical protein